MLQPRHQKFLEELPKNGYKMKPAAIKAGYSPMYAHANGKKILETATKEKAKEIIEMIDKKELTTKQEKTAIYELLGMNKEDVYKNVKWLAEQEKDLSTRLKVITAIAKELNINLTTEEAPKTIVPVLNIGVRPVNDGSTEPYIEAPQDSRATT